MKQRPCFQADKTHSDSVVYPVLCEQVIGVKPSPDRSVYNALLVVTGMLVVECG
jgi:hypothetical protein